MNHVARFHSWVSVWPQERMFCATQTCRHSPPRSNPPLYLSFSRFFLFALFTPWHLSMSRFPPTSRTCNPYASPTPSLSSARCPAGLTHWEVMHCGMQLPPPPFPLLWSHIPFCLIIICWHGNEITGVMGKGHWEIEAHWCHSFFLSFEVKPESNSCVQGIWTERENRENTKKKDKFKKCKPGTFSAAIFLRSDYLRHLMLI